MHDNMVKTTTEYIYIFRKTLHMKQTENSYIYVDLFFNFVAFRLLLLFVPRCVRIFTFRYSSIAATPSFPFWYIFFICNLTVEKKAALHQSQTLQSIPNFTNCILREKRFQHYYHTNSIYHAHFFHKSPYTTNTHPLSINAFKDI